MQWIDEQPVSLSYSQMSFKSCINLGQSKKSDKCVKVLQGTDDNSLWQKVKWCVM